MLNRIIHFSLHNRIVILAAAVMIVVAGIVATTHTEVDVFPDLNAPTVVVMTEAGGMATEEVEQLVTFPIETAVNGATGVRRVRSQSAGGFSVVWIEFDWGTDIYLARQIVSEKLAGIGSQLPEGVSAPVMGPQSSILGEVLIVGLTSDSTSMLDLRTLADWTIRPRLLGVGGVAQVSVQGGDIKEYQVVLSPAKMKHYGVTLDEVMDATRGMNTNRNGGVVYEYGNEYIVRSITSTADTDGLASCLVRRSDGGMVTLADIADVRIGAQEPKLGVASERAKPAVLLTVTKQPATGTIELTEDLDKALDDLKATLPPDVHVSTNIFRQADFIASSIDNVKRALIEGAFFVVIILFIFLANVRTTVISLVTIPLAFLVTVIVLHLLGISINTMTLGGLAIAIGSLVDDAIVDVENVHRRLNLEASKTKELKTSKTKDLIYEASREVRMPILNSTLIIVVSFVPLFFLDGMEGRMLIPLGIAFITALFASTLVALTLTPVLCSYLLKAGGTGTRPEAPVARWLKAHYRRALDAALRYKRAVLAVVVAVFAVAVVAFCTLGTSFLPAFNEGSFTINISSLPGISLNESDAIGRRAEKMLLEVPEIKTVARKTGRAELDEHALGVNVSEIEAPFVLDGRSHEEVLSDVRHRLSTIAGANIEIGQPITHRIDAMLSGTQANIAIKLFGTDLNRMFTIGNEIKEAIEDVPGIADLNVEQQVERPELKITPRRELLVQNGITLPEFNEFVAVNLAGETVSQVYEGGHSFDLVVKAGPKATMEDIRSLIIDTQDGRKVPLTDVADVESAAGPNTINRENCQRKIVISANTSGRALGDVVDDIRDRVGQHITLPEGYRVEYGGQFESQQSASRTLLFTCIGALLVIFLLIFLQFRSVKESLVVLLNLPLALIGSVFAIFVTDGELSIPAIIGFISLFGIATRNGMLLITEYGRLRTEEGLGIHEAVVSGSLSRLNPILMTALTSALALVPLALSGDLPGNEIQSPMAKVILGGLISSTILNAFIVPIVYEWVMASKTKEPTNSKTKELTNSKTKTLITVLALCSTLQLSAQTIDDALASIATNNVRLRALAADNDASLLESQVDNIVGGPSIEYSPFFENGKTGLGASELIVSQSFDFPTLYRQRREQAALDADVRSQQYAAALRDVMLQARLAALDVVRTNQLIDMHRQRLAETDTILSLLQRRIEAGDATSLEVNKARLTRMAVQQQLAETEADRAARLAELQSLNGGEPIDITQRKLPEYTLAANFDDFLAEACSANPDISAAEANVRARDNELRTSRQAWLPQFSVGYRRNTDGPIHSHGFLVGAAFPLYSTSARVKAARARQQAAQQELDAARQEAEDALRLRYAELLRLHNVLDHSDTALLQETLTLLTRALQYGQLTALEYYTETADIYEKLQAHIDLHARYASLFTELHRNL